MTGQHIPPNNLEAEASVISAVLLDSSGATAALALPELEPEDFYSPENRLIWKAATSLYTQSRTVPDATTVHGWLKGKGMDRNAGGLPYIAKILDAAPSIQNVQAYAGIVKSVARRRRKLELLKRLAAEGTVEAGDDWDKRVDEAIAAMARDSVPTTARPVTVGDAIKEHMREAVRIGNSGTGMVGIPTGITTLDNRLRGLKPGKLYVIGARPGMGKTALLGDMARAAARHTEAGVKLAALVISAEMTKEEIACRILSSEAEVDGELIANHNVQGDEKWRRLTAASERLDDLAIFLVDKPRPTLSDITAAIAMTRQEVAQWTGPDGEPYDLGAVFVDYIQIAGLPKADRMDLAIGEFTCGLKALSKTEKVPVIALSQLNRGVESRPDKRPNMADLREGGSIEQDADVIMFLYRDAYYNRQSKFGDATEINVAKNRGGQRGRCLARFEGPYTRFTNLSDSEIEQLEREETTKTGGAW